MLLGMNARDPRIAHALAHPMLRATDLDLERAAARTIYKSEHWTTIFSVNR
jgi:hypothetical protein